MRAIQALACSKVFHLYWFSLVHFFYIIPHTSRLDMWNMKILQFLTPYYQLYKIGMKRISFVLHVSLRAYCNS